jgi:hypothetical protein
MPLKIFRFPKNWIFCDLSTIGRNVSYMVMQKNGILRFFPTNFACGAVLLKNEVLSKNFFCRYVERIDKKRSPAGGSNGQLVT